MKQITIRKAGTVRLTSALVIPIQLQHRPSAPRQGNRAGNRGSPGAEAHERGEG